MASPRAANLATSFLEGRARVAHVLHPNVSAALRGVTDLVHLVAQTVTLASVHISDPQDAATELQKRKDAILARATICFDCVIQLLDHYQFYHSMVHATADREGNPNPSINRRAQTEWLMTFLFDQKGNSRFCAKCVKAIFSLSHSRYSRLHKLAQEQNANGGFEVLPRKDVTREREQDVVLPEEEHPLKWWRDLPQDAMVKLRRSLVLHKLTGRPSNNKKAEITLQRFLTFVDENSLPNGRSAQGRHADRYWSPQFTRIAPFSTEELASLPPQSPLRRSSVVGEFNCSQLALDPPGQTVSENTVRTWMEEHRRNVVLAPHSTDYCDTCSELQTTLKSLDKEVQLRKGTSSEDVMRELEASIHQTKQRREDHRIKAAREREFYKDRTRKCREAWQAIQVESDESLRKKLQDDFELVIAVDFMQERLIPYFGSSPQPGQTYYKMKLVVHLFGLVSLNLPTTDHMRNYVYLTDEVADGPKTSDHLLSYLDNFVKHLPPWIKKLCVYGDNARTIKSQYIVGWAHEKVLSGQFHFIRISFMIPGHTKFAPDQLFAQISKDYNRTDVYNIDDLVSVCKMQADAVELFGADRLRSWREALEKKFKSVPGITDYRMITFEKRQGEVEVRSSETSWEEARLKKLKILRNDMELPLPASKQPRTLQPNKFKDLKDTYEQFIPLEKRPAFLSAQTENIMSV